MPDDQAEQKLPLSKAGPTGIESRNENQTQAKSEITNRMEDVLQLLNQRMEGQVSTTQVESAVSDLLTTLGTRQRAQETNQNASSNAISKEPAKLRNNESQGPSSSIQEDMGNYDDSSDDDNEEERKTVTTSSPTKEPTKKKRRLGSKQNEGKESPDLPSNFDNDEEYQDAISQIPMGKEAAKMMTTFGDGPRPLPDSLELALIGTRKALQVSIMDARKVRRRLQNEYRDVQSLFTRYGSDKRLRYGDKTNPTLAAASAWAAEQQQESASSPSKNDAAKPTTTRSESNSEQEAENGDESDKIKTTTSVTPSKSQKVYEAGMSRPTANSVDPRLLYRVMADGTDKLSYAHKCGFHVEELTHLYPEEMMAYQRWNEMQEEYNESKASDGNDDDGSNDKVNEGDPSNSNTANDNGELDGGHLRERAANFDYRTGRMKDDWYVEYAKVRQGSFLPNAKHARRTKTEMEWDRLRKLKKGKRATGEWENISGRAVRFLHWLGFDPPNLYPPDEETTQALGFLAYDRLGRIVEKAVFLRNERSDTSTTLCELPAGEQLSVGDIERALEDSDVKPATVYGTEDSKTASSVQLYFGPGWEDRLELEMDEMIASLRGSNHQVSEEERMVRDHEMELLNKISAPPKRTGDTHLETLVKNHKESTTETKTTPK